MQLKKERTMMMYVLEYERCRDKVYADVDVTCVEWVAG